MPQVQVNAGKKPRKETDTKRNSLGHEEVPYTSLTDDQKVMVATAKGLGAALVRFTTQYQDYWELDLPGAVGKRTAYDVDIHSSLRILAQHTTASDRARALDAFDPTDYTHSKGRRVQISGKGSGTCAVCGDPGGVPCPKMLFRARDLMIELKAPQGANLHPGRCRAGLKKLIETGLAKRA